MAFYKLTPAVVDSTLDFTFNNVTATGNLISLNANLGNAAVANYFIGNGSLLTGLPASYANSNVANYLPTYNGLIGGTLTTAAQPNITSVSTLTSLTVSGLITATGNIKTATVQGTDGTVVLQTNYNTKAGDLGVVGNIVAGTGGSGNVSATYFVGNGAFLTGITGTGTYSNANVANYLPSYSGNLTAGNVDFTLAGNVTLGANSNIHITGGTTGQYLKTDGSGNLSWGTPSGGSGGGITYTAATTPPGTPSVADQWYNTTTNTLYEYMNDGTTSFWVDIQTPTVSVSNAGNNSAGFVTRNYTGSGSQTNFTITAGLSASSVLVVQDGVVQTPTSDYTVSGTTLVFTTAPASGSNIQIRELAYSISTTSTLASSSSIIVNGNLSVTATVTSTSIRAQAMTMGIIFGG